MEDFYRQVANSHSLLGLATALLMGPTPTLWHLLEFSHSESDGFLLKRCWRLWLFRLATGQRTETYGRACQSGRCPHPSAIYQEGEPGPVTSHPVPENKEKQVKKLLVVTH